MIKFCLWGGRGDWIQVGSRADQRLQSQLRLSALMYRQQMAIQQMMQTMGQMLLPSVQRAQRAMVEFAAALEQSRLW